MNTRHNVALKRAIASEIGADIYSSSTKHARVAERLIIPRTIPRTLKCLLCRFIFLNIIVYTAFNLILTQLFETNKAAASLKDEIMEKGADMMRVLKQMSDDNNTRWVNEVDDRNLYMMIDAEDMEQIWEGTLTGACF
jgi:hypothetical protein